MYFFKTKFFSLVSLYLLLFPNFVLAQTEGIPESESEAESSAPQIVLYQQAKKELDSDFYALYRIVDRVSRANQFDDRSWVVTVVPRLKNSPVSNNLNSIEIERRALRLLNGDSSGVACIVSREIARRTHNYRTLDETQKQELIAKIKEEAKEEVLGKKNNTLKHNAMNVVGSVITDHLLPGFIGDFAGSVIGSRRHRRRISRKKQKRIDEIVVRKTQELEQSWIDETRSRELELDKSAYLATVRAGFEAEGCLRAMTILAQSNKDDVDAGNLTVSQRITALKNSIAEYPLQKLLREGKTKISHTQPLAYNLSEDGNSLKVNYSQSDSVANDIDRRFGN